jgi:ABC-2 type transport system ATP-binding protein
VLAQTNLEQVVHQTIDTLSKGFKRRVGLAQALIHDPEVLILDEPTDGLDPNQKALIHDLIDRLARDKCIILSTHILDEVERVCNRAMIISAGKILVDSTPDELIRRAPRHNVIRLSLRQEAPDVFVRIKNQDWCAQLIPLSPTSADICPVNGENHLTDLLELTRDAEVSSVQLQEGRLDDLFREITGGVAA